MTETRVLSLAQNKRLVREQLSAAFPGVKFSVTATGSRHFRDLQVTWVDGPTPDQVDAAAGRYTSYQPDQETGRNWRRGASEITWADGRTEMVYFAADNLHVRRDLSALFTQRVLRLAATITGSRLGVEFQVGSLYPEFDTGYGVCPGGDGSHLVWFLSSHIPQEAVTWFTDDHRPRKVGFHQMLATGAAGLPVRVTLEVAQEGQALGYTLALAEDGTVVSALHRHYRNRDGKSGWWDDGAQFCGNDADMAWATWAGDAAARVATGRVITDTQLRKAGLPA